VLDRVIQQALAQEPGGVFEKEFSENSYAYRPGRNAHDALRAVRTAAAEGYTEAVDCDLKGFSIMGWQAGVGVVPDVESLPSGRGNPGANLVEGMRWLQRLVWRSKTGARIMQGWCKDDRTHLAHTLNTL
jgi:hypothetical protein